MAASNTTESTTVDASASKLAVGRFEPGKIINMVDDNQTQGSIMSELGTSLKVVLADTFVMYMMAHKYHFNVEGSDFFQLHDMFGQIYNDLWSSLDTTGEHIRAQDEYVPFNFGRLMELATWEDDNKIPTASGMIEKLLDANTQVIQSLNASLEQAKIANQEGVVNYLGARLEIHGKHGWMLRATGKKNRS
jgi:starvation-inducible DNA-binding protein